MNYKLQIYFRKECHTLLHCKTPDSRNIIYIYVYISDVYSRLCRYSYKQSKWNAPHAWGKKNYLAPRSIFLATWSTSTTNLNTILGRDGSVLFWDVFWSSLNYLTINKFMDLTIWTMDSTCASATCSGVSIPSPPRHGHMRCILAGRRWSEREPQNTRRKDQKNWKKP